MFWVLRINFQSKVIRLKISFVKIIIIAFGAMITAPAFACKISGLEYEVRFEEGRSEIGSANAGKLVEWFLRWRDGVGIRDEIVIYTYLVNDKNIKIDSKEERKLTAERIANIKRLLTPLKSDSATIEEATFQIGSEYGSKKLQPYYSNTIEVGVQPACTRTGTCCLIPIK